MKIEDQVKQLTELMADLIPTVDRLAQNQEKHSFLMAELIPTVARLAQNQEKNTEAIQQVVKNQEKNTEAIRQVIEATGKTNLAVSEMRLSNLRLAEAIEKLVAKIDKVDQFEDRLVKLERSVFKS